MRNPILASFCLCLLMIADTASAEGKPLRIGTLPFGTLNWELSVIRDEGLDKAHGLALETTPLASAEAGRIALQGGGVDLIVSDWIWVAQQRGQGFDFTFVPYSTSHGALVVPAGSPIRGIPDLAGKRLGIAGGGLDKNWLLLRALAQKAHRLDLDRVVEKTFGAPPLLNQQLQQGRLDAVLDYWNYAAKLEALGYRRLLDGHGILSGLGIQAEVPALGYVFREAWAKANRPLLTGFLRAGEQAKRAICESETTWRKVSPLTQEPDEKTRQSLRQYYCAGRVTRFGAAEQRAAQEILALLKATAGEAAALPAALPEGVFWPAGAAP